MPDYLTPLSGYSVSEAYAEAMAVAPIGRAMLYTVEINHPQLSESLRAVLAHGDVTATLEASAPYNAGEAVLFRALPLGVQLPQENDQAPSPAVRIWLDGVSRYVADQLDYTVSSLEQAEMILRVYASDDLTGPANNPPLRMDLTHIRLTEQRVEATAMYSDPANRGFPGKTFNRKEYPGL